MGREEARGARGTLELTEPHPAAQMGMSWIKKQSLPDLVMWQESFSSCAIEGNRLAEVCSETLHRLMTGQPVSDRYLLGLVYTMRFREEENKEVKVIWKATCKLQKKPKTAPPAKGRASKSKVIKTHARRKAKK